MFRLKGLNQNSRFHEKSFDDLLEEDQRALRQAVLRTLIVKQLNPEDNTSMYHIFERLNTGGTLLASQEIRNCVYRGKFSRFLNEVNGFEDWRRILGAPKPDARKRDIELVLRFLAMRDVAAYSKPMKDFLSKFMQKKQESIRTTTQKKQRSISKNM